MSTTKVNIGTATYLELISKDAKDVQKENLEFQAQDAKLAVDSAVLETKKALSNAKRDLLSAQVAIPYNLNNEIQALTRITNLEEGLAIAQQIQAVRFN
jgi:hypothetical protein